MLIVEFIHLVFLKSFTIGLWPVFACIFSSLLCILYQVSNHMDTQHKGLDIYLLWILWSCGLCIRRIILLIHVLCSHFFYGMLPEDSCHFHSISVSGFICVGFGYIWFYLVYCIEMFETGKFIPVTLIKLWWYLFIIHCCGMVYIITCWYC